MRNARRDSTSGWRTGAQSRHSNRRGFACRPEDSAALHPRLPASLSEAQRLVKATAGECLLLERLSIRRTEQPATGPPSLAPVKNSSTGWPDRSGTKSGPLDACVGRARREHLFERSEIICTRTLYDMAWNGLPRRNLGSRTPEELFKAFLDAVYTA